VDLQSEHKRYLNKQYAKKPVIVMNYSQAIKVCYTRVNADGSTVAAMDVLASGIGGSQQEERLDVLDQRITERVTGLAQCARCHPFSAYSRQRAVGAVIDALWLGSDIERGADASKKVVLVERLAQVAHYTIPERALPHAVVRIGCNQNGRYGLSQSHQMAMQF